MADDRFDPASLCLELCLDPEDLPLLLRQPEFAAARKARGQAARRGVALSIIWHDTPNGALAADGMALAQRHEGDAAMWRLERMVPDATCLWPPGGVIPAITESVDPPATAGGAFGRIPTGPLLALAAFDGEQHILLPADAPVQVVLLDGELRAVAAKRRVCRLTLTGADATSLALRWAALLRLSAPRLSLAAEAFALARTAEPQRPLGAPALWAAQTTGDGFAFVVAHLAGVIQHHAPAALAMQGPEPVHQMRVALRRLRSAMLLFRRAVSCPALDDANRRLKALGSVLGPPRDWDVFTAGAGRAVGAAFAEDEDVAALLATAERQRKLGYAALARFLESPAWRELGIVLADIALRRPWQDFTPDDPAQAVRHHELQRAGISEFAARALHRRLEAVIAPGEDLSGLTLPDLHNIRLHAKRLRYAAEFFAPLFPGRTTRRFLRRMAELQERLGQLNDSAVAADLMSELPGRGARHAYAVGVVRGYVAAQTGGGRRKIEQSWHRFLRAEPFWK